MEFIPYSIFYIGTLLSCRHSRESGNPGKCLKDWIPAFAGMTRGERRTTPIQKSGKLFHDRYIIRGMADQPKKSAEEAFLQNIWGKRASGIDITNIDWSRPISHQDVQFLLNHYPFLQILSLNPKFDPNHQIQLIRSESGWTIQDYGCAHSSSPGEFLFGGGYWIHTGWNLPAKKEEDEGGDGGDANPIINSGKGTIVKQAFDTATEMVEIAVQKGWPGIELINGNELMKWAAWMRAEDYELKVKGFSPSEQHRQKRERVKRELDSMPVMRKQLGH